MNSDGDIAVWSAVIHRVVLSVVVVVGAIVIVSVLQGSSYGYCSYFCCC